MNCMTSRNIEVWWDPMLGTFSVSECPDCGAGKGEPCAWACSSNWDREELDA